MRRLLQPSLDVIPLLGGNEARNAVDGDDLLGDVFDAEHRERDPLMDEPAVHTILESLQVFGGDLGDGGREAAAARARGVPSS